MASRSASDRVYLIDTSALIETVDLFGSEAGHWWRWLEHIAESGRAKLPTCVASEYTNDEWVAWIRARPSLILKPSNTQQQALSDLMCALPEFVEPSKPDSDADQPLVAAAMAINLEACGRYASGPAWVVTKERHRKAPGGRLRIPDACDHFSICHCRIGDMMAAEGCFDAKPGQMALDI